MCFDQIRPHYLLSSSSFSSTPPRTLFLNSISSFLETTESMECCPDVHASRRPFWRVGSLSVTTSLRKPDLSQSLQLSVAPQRREGLHEPLSHPCWDFHCLCQKIIFLSHLECEVEHFQCSFPFRGCQEVLSSCPPRSRSFLRTFQEVLGLKEG